MQHEMQHENYKPTRTRGFRVFVSGFESHPLRENESTHTGREWLVCVLFLCCAWRQSCFDRAKRYCNRIHMQHKCNTKTQRYATRHSTGASRRGSASAPFISLFSRFISAASADIISAFVHFSFLRLMAITIFLLTVLLCVSTPAQLILHFREAYRFYAPAKPQPFRGAPYSLYRAPLFPNKNTVLHVTL